MQTCTPKCVLQTAPESRPPSPSRSHSGRETGGPLSDREIRITGSRTLQPTKTRARRILAQSLCE
eukprot:3872549-Alexandrium_andersonii.AAC.1